MQCDECDLETEYNLLRELAVVDTIRHDTVREKASSDHPSARLTDRVICTLWCGSTHPIGDLRQPSVKCNQSTVPSLARAVRAVRLKIANHHAGCVATAEAARAAAEAPATRLSLIHI